MADPSGAVDGQALHGPGLIGLTHANGQPVTANGQPVTVGPRQAIGGGRARGSVPIGWAAWLLSVTGAGALYVSFAAQRQYVFAARHQDLASIIEALLLDAMMIVFTLLALGLSMARKSSRTERALILACAVASAGMNVSAADVTSPRSVAAYAVPPIALAIVVDRVVAVIRRHVLADDEVSAWTTLASFLAGVARTTAAVLLYSVRFILAPSSTAAGVRLWILNLTPLPTAGPRPEVTHSVNPAPALASVTEADGPAEPGGSAVAAEPGGSAVAAEPGGSAVAAEPGGSAVAAEPGGSAVAAEPGGSAVAAEPGGSAVAAEPGGDASPGSPATHGPDPRAPQSARAPLSAEPAVTAEPVTDEVIAAFYATELEAGRVPSGKEIRRQFSVGSGRADRIVGQLTAALAERGAG